jgi:hypothetical protein
MDFLSRNANNQPQTPRSNGTQTSTPAPTGRSSEKSKSLDYLGSSKWLRVVFVVLLFSLTVLAISITILIYFGKPNEAHAVDTKKEQAVFLTNGQVYFGKITTINQDFVNLTDIYYLNSTSADTSATNKTQQTSFSLVKLGCELHGPADQMIINRAQVSFWENLTSTGKVSKAIEQFRSQNPNGQTCSDSNSTNSTQQSGASTTPAANTGTTTTKP